MKETLELRINYDYAHLLFKADEGKNIGTSVRVVDLSKEDPRYNLVPIIAEEVNKKYGKSFFFGWKIKRKYSKKELDTATLFQLIIKTTFDPTNEEFETLDDKTESCEICGANSEEIPLILKIKKMPKKDIVRTIWGEMIVSEKFVNTAELRNLKGLQFNPINVGKYYRLTAKTEIELSSNTIAGINPFDLSISSEEEIYKCSKCNTIGLNILSEAYVLNDKAIGEYDFYMSKQKLGVKRGLLHPEPIFLCSADFRKMVIEEKLTGFDFEIAHVE